METSVNSEVLERGFQKLTLSELEHQRSNYRARIHHLQNEISNLAFSNYRTYANVGRMAEHCKDMFSEINQFMMQVKREFPSLLDGVEKFHTNSANINAEYLKLDEINSINCYVWELLKLPKLMDKCIRAGKYETAYALTNFAVNIKQTKLIHNPMIKEIANVLIEARHGLLDELFNKFAGPIDLTKSIQVVNNIRKIPYISNSQLRVSILQYRDIYLEKNVLSISSEPDFALRVIEVYRDCMYDTIVLYMAVFPSNSVDIQRKYISSLSSADDSRWERWTGSSQTYLLQSWAHRNIERLFSFLHMAEAKSALNMETMAGKLMSFAFSFGRMGLDFRSLVLHEFAQLIVDGFRRKVAEAVKSLTSIKKLDLVDGDIFESTMNELEESSVPLNISSGSIMSAPLELCVWDDICVFGNQIIEALNESRHLLAINYINQMFDIIKYSLQDLFKWIDDCFLKKASNVDSASIEKVDEKLQSSTDSASVTWTKVDEARVQRATKLLLQHFVPFINKCFFSCFPYDKCCRQLFMGHLSLEKYVESYSLLSSNLFAQCRNDVFFTKTLDEVRANTPALIEFFFSKFSTTSETSKDAGNEMTSPETKVEQEENNHQQQLENPKKNESELACLESYDMSKVEGADKSETSASPNELMEKELSEEQTDS